MDPEELAVIGRAIIDSNTYLTLGTTDDAGRPWVSPVYYASKAYRELYWISSPEVAHSRNLARRPEVSIVVFDSRAPVGQGQAVYMAARAGEVVGDEVRRGLEVYPGPDERGGRRLTPAELRPPGPYRLYRAEVSQHWMVCPRTSGPCTTHDLSYDHRTEVAL